MIPIVARSLTEERVGAAAELDLVQVQPTLAPKSLPLGQVTRSLDLFWEDPILTRWDRHPQIALQASSTNGTLPFGFMSVLGAMSPVGMLIKDAILLFDEIDLNRSQGESPYDSVIGADIARVRSVALAALTTVLGVAPLLQDVLGVSHGCWRQRRVSHGAISSMPESPSR